MEDSPPSHLPAGDLPSQHDDDQRPPPTITTITTAASAKIIRDLPATQPPPPQRPRLPSTTSSTRNAPPFWTLPAPHARTISTHSLTRPTAITLSDNSTSTPATTLWATTASIPTYTLITGPSGIGAYIVYNIHICLLSGSLELTKRYSEFASLRADLLRAFPGSGEHVIPELPRKSVVSRFRPDFLEQRREGLGRFLECVVLNPEFAGSVVVREFVFS